MSETSLPAVPVAELVPRPLTAREAEELLQRVTELARAGGNLPTGLRAAAASTTQSSLSEAYKLVANRLEQGLPLDAALRVHPQWLPPYLVSLVSAAVRSGDCTAVLSDMVDLRTRLHSARYELRSAMFYPLITLCFAALVMVFIINTCVPGLTNFLYECSDAATPGWRLRPIRTYEDIGSLADSWAWLYQEGQWDAFLWLGIVGGLLLVARFALPWAVWCRLCSALPVVGPIWQWSALAEFTKLLSLLLKHELPLAQAARLAGAAVQNGEVQVAALQLAEQLERGVPVATALNKAPQTFPSLMIPFIETGLRTDSLSASCDKMSGLFFERVASRTQLLRTIGPPAVFLLVGLFVLSFMGAFFLVLTHMLSYLSTFGGGGGGSIARRLFAYPQLLIFIPPTIAVLIAVRLMFRGSRGVGRYSLEAFLVMLEWRFLAFCFILLLFTTSVYLFIPACLIAAFVLIRLGGGYSALHKRLLLWNLAAAGEAQVPLLPVLRATAEESPGRLQRAASYAANLVESGSVISTALARAWYWLSYDMRFALLAAEATSQFGSTLRQALSLEHRSRQQKQHVSDKLSYLSWVIFVVVMIVTFILLKIIPVVAKMFDEFGLELPAMTQLVIDISQYVVIKSWFLVPFVLLNSCILVALFEPAIARWLAFFCPPLELLWMKRHGTTILRGMAVMVQHGRPLSEAFNVAAEQYPIAFVRGRLLAAKQRMQEGQAWPEVLRRSWFISRADAALLAAAERSNHLDWALESVADNIDRRLNLRVQFLASLIFPSILLVMSMFIAMIALAIMMPLISLTQGLAGGPARRR